MKTLACALAVLGCVAVAGQSSGTIDVSGLEVSTASRSIPPRGCTCLDIRDSPCLKYECGCTCNLNAQQCDTNCCCDSECSTEQVSAFRTAGQCLAEGPANSTFLQCSDLTNDPALALVNPKYRMQVAGHSTVDSIMCVAVVNNPVVGSFFTDPVPSGAAGLDPSTFDRDDVSAVTGSTFLPVSTPTPTTATEFSVGATIPAAVEATAGTLTPLNGNVLSVLGSGMPGASCTTSSVVGYRTSLAASAADANGVLPNTMGTNTSALQQYASSTARCRVQGGLTAAVCATLSPASWASTLRIGAAPNAVPSGGLAGYVTPTVVSVQDQDAATGDLSASTVAAAAAGSAYNTTTGQCSGAVSQVALSLHYSNTGTITAAFVSIVTTTLSPSSVGGSIPAQVSTSVVFEPNEVVRAAIATSAGAGNIVARGTSGSPGYLYGAPLLAGVQPSATEAVFPDPRGLLVLAPAADGSCATTTSNNMLLIAVGEDVSASCLLSMTAAQLATACASTSVPVATTVNASHVGGLGNSDPLAPNEWVPLDQQSGGQTTTFDADTSTCSNAVVGVHLQFMTAFVGKQDNPQLKVVAARSQYILGAWQYTRGDGGAQSFPVQTVVTWTHLPDEELKELLPPPPTIIPSLPSDFFYPFEIPRTQDLIVSRSVPSSVVWGYLLLACAAMWHLA